MGPDHCLGNLVVPTIRPEMTSPAPELVRVLSSTPEIRKDTPGYLHFLLFFLSLILSKKIKESRKKSFVDFILKIFGYSYLFLLQSLLQNATSDWQTDV